MANMFDENGNYNKTEWKPGDRITAGKLNKIEESLEAINNNDIERHKEADERLDALEEQNEAVEERFDELEDLVADNKSEVDTSIYEVHSKMDRLEQEMNDGIDTVEAIAHTVDDKIAEADASMKAQVAEVEANLEGLHAKDDELSEQLADITTKLNNDNILNLKDFGAKCDGITDDSDSLILALNNFTEGQKILIPENTVINKNITIKDKGNISIEGNSVLGVGAILIQSSTSEFTSMSSSISDGDYKFEVIPGVSVGDYLIIKGTIYRDDYNVNRLTNASSIHKITEIGGNFITLDTPVRFNLTNPSIAKLTKPFLADINIKTDGVHIGVTNCIGGNINTVQENINIGMSALEFECCRDLNIDSVINNSCVTIGMVCNNVYYSNIKLKGKLIGSNDVTIGSKSLRGNAIVSCFINVITEKSKKICSTIYGSKNLVMSVNSNNSGYLNRLKNNANANRSEAFQFSECDNITVDGIIHNCDDQALEFLACKNVKSAIQISTLEKSTEGAIVIKGGSKNITLLNPIINCNNDCAIKIEGTTPDGSTPDSSTDIDKCTSDINIYNANIIASSSGIYIRDYAKETDSNVKINGGFISAEGCIMINDHSNSNSISNLECISTKSHCIAILASNNNINNVSFKNTNSNSIRAVSVRGSNNSVRNCNTDGGYIYIGGAACNDFTLTKYANNTCDIFIETFNGIISSKRGFWETDWLHDSSSSKTFGQAKVGDIIRRINPYAGSSNISYWVCHTDGSFCSDNFNAILN